MGVLNPKLKPIIERHLSPIKHHIKVINNEADAILLIKKTGMFNFDGCDIYYKLNVNSILQKLKDSKISINNIRIVNSRIHKGISFCDVSIGGNLYFWENQCDNICDFSNIEVLGYSYFSNTLFQGDAIFDYSTFHRDCFFWSVTFLGEAHLRSCTFLGRIDFWCANFQKKGDLSHSSFSKDVDFSNTTFNTDISFRDTSFGDLDNSSIAIFDNVLCDGSISFHDSNIKSEVSICKSDIKGVIDYSRCSLQSTFSCAKSSYSGIVFNDSHIYSPLYLLDSQRDINNVDFQRTWIDSIVNLRFSNEWHIGTLSFNNSIFSSHSIVTIEGVLSKSMLGLNYCNILGVVSMYTSKIDCIALQCTSVIGSLIIKDTTIQNIDLTNATSTGRIITDSNYCINPINRETANILRHQKEKEGDIIMSLKYKEIEMRRYKKEFDSQPLKTRLKNLDEIIIVKFNYWSNDYGQSWTRGVIFTIIVSFIFSFVLYFLEHELLFSFKNIIHILTHQYFWKDVINFLWFPSSDFNSNEILYVVIALIGKVLVAYGMFQTAMSFRKYNKS